MFNFINMNTDENTNTFIHNLIEDFQQDLSGNPRMILLNNLINIIQGNQLNENVSMLPLASNIMLPQQQSVRSILQRSLFEKNFSDFPCSPGIIISHVSTNKKGSLWGINFLISSISNFIFLDYFLLLLFSINLYLLQEIRPQHCYQVYF